VTDALLLPALRRYGRIIEPGSTEAIKRGAMAGMGIACLSRMAVEDTLSVGQLVALSTPLPALRRQLQIVMHRRKQVTPALQRLLTLLVSGAESGAPH